MDRGLVVDGVVVAVVVFALVRGWRNGSLRETLGLFGLLLGLLLAPALVGPIADVVRSLIGLEINLARLAALLLVVAVVETAVILIGKRKLGDAQISGPRWLDRAGGIVIASFRGLFIATLFLYAMLAVSASNPQLPGYSEGVTSSFSGQALADTGSAPTVLFDAVVARSDDTRALTIWVRQQTSLDLTSGSDRVRFARVQDVKAAPEAERELFELMNRAREARGLAPLGWCEQCAAVARAHSRDMYESGYFSHVDMEGLDPFERLLEAGVGYESAGENLALAPSPEQAIDGLLASPDHRANILHGAFDQAAIGIYNGPYGLLVTQLFRAAP